MAKEVICSSCGCKVSYKWNDQFVTCPLCKNSIDIKMALVAESTAGAEKINVIKYESSQDMIVWKHPIQNFKFGTQLIVQESQVAIFYKNGQALDTFEAGKYTLNTEKLPILNRIFSIPSDQDIFQSEVYFVSMSTHMANKWGTDSKVRVFDPESGLHLELGAFGNFSIRVSDARKLLYKLIGTNDELSASFIAGNTNSQYSDIGLFKSLIINKVKSNLARLIKENNVSILEIDAYLDVLSEKMKEAINGVLDDYGLTMPEFYITNIMTPDDNPDFRRLKKQYADRTLKVREEEIKKAEAEALRERRIVEAETAAELRRIEASGSADALKIKAEAEAQAYRMQAEAEAQEMKSKGYSYQQETARQVGMEAMQNGITGSGDGASMAGALGDVAGIGVALGAMGGIVNMTKDAISPVFQDSTDIGKSVGEAASASSSNIAWDCNKCGTKGVTSNFCPNCGSPKLIQTNWDCVNCGTTNITSRFCPNCGTQKPGA